MPSPFILLPLHVARAGPPDLPLPPCRASRALGDQATLLMAAPRASLPSPSRGYDRHLMVPEIRGMRNHDSRRGLVKSCPEAMTARGVVRARTSCARLAACQRTSTLVPTSTHTRSRQLVTASRNDCPAHTATALERRADRRRAPLTDRPLHTRHLPRTEM